MTPVGAQAPQWSNVNPYGTLRLGMDKRLDSGPAAARPRPRTSVQAGAADLHLAAASGPGARSGRSLLGRPSMTRS
jgi:hypothetical protein